MTIVSRRQVLAGLTGGIAALLPAPSAAQNRAIHDRAALTLNDASLLSPVRMARAATIDTRTDETLIAGLRDLLREAAAEKRPLAMAGARHSMGGQSLASDGIAAALAGNGCIVDRDRKLYSAGAGTRWRDVIGALDPLRLSVAVMQSNSDFSIGGTLSVNAHGWPCPYGPFVSTVRSFRLMLADGTVMTCSRTQNTELFGLVAGGYGLCGIVIDVQIETSDNTLLLPRYELVDADAVAPSFIAAATGSDVQMAYGRLSVARDGFLSEGLVVSYRPVSPQPEKLPAAERSAAYAFVSRQLFRAQIGSERGKTARWYAETVLLPPAAVKKPITRNAILSYPVSVLAETSRQRTDILHEYFLPPERFAAFLTTCRALIPRSQDLLNVTLRYVAADHDSVLAFAPQPRIAAVMLFSQARTVRADADARTMTQNLIDAALKLGGSYYLPYRLHARPDQFYAAYPKAAEFGSRKRHYDPQLLFRNQLWDAYFS